MKSLLGWTAVAIAGLIALVLLAHVFIPPVNPAQDSPPGHFASACGACHFISDSVKVRTD